MSEQLGFNPYYSPGRRYPGNHTYVLPQSQAGTGSPSGKSLLLGPVLLGTGISLVIAGDGREVEADAKGVMLAINLYSVFAAAALGAYILLEIVDHDSKPTDGLIPIGLAFNLCMLYFASVYDMVYTLFPQSFTGKIGETSLEKFFSFVYFSIMTFATAGSGDIVPETIGTRMLVSMEVLFFIFIATLGVSFFVQAAHKK
ncbi:hypothetical protein JCM15765_20920 [Paradesulfitobacterium aromaticivorans]